MSYRYRLRTWLREHLPEPLSRLFPPGRRDCGDHEWFRADETTDRCWHCEVGEREHRPVPIDPDSSVWQALQRTARSGDSVSQGIALRMMAEHEAYEAQIAEEYRRAYADAPEDEIWGRAGAAHLTESVRELGRTARGSA